MFTKVVEISVLLYKLCRNVQSYSFLFPFMRIISLAAKLRHKYARLLKVVENWWFTLVHALIVGLGYLVYMTLLPDSVCCCGIGT